MSVHIDGRSVAIPDAGLIFHSVDLRLYDPKQQEPPHARAVMMLMEDDSGELCWEHGEWQDGTGTFERGWYFIGMNERLDSRLYRVRLWCDEPQIPNLKALGWGAHGQA